MATIRFVLSTPLLFCGGRVKESVETSTSSIAAALL